MSNVTPKLEKRRRREARIRARVRGNAVRPRLSVHRSLRHVSVQLIDDARGATIASVSDAELMSDKGKKKKLPSRRERGEWVGAEIAKRAKEKGISMVRFDRGSFRYHGVVKAVAESARKGGLLF